MGLCQSCLHTRERDELRVAMQATILATGIDEPHFWKMYTQFKQANKAHNNQLLLNEFLDYLDVPRSPLVERLFALYKDGEDSIGFKLFTLFSWNLCTSDDTTLPLFSFCVYDTNNNGVLGLDELQALMRDTYGEDYRSRAGPRALEDSLCEKDLAGNPLSASVTIERFAVAMQNAPSVLAAAFHLQRALRTRFLGNAFWEKLTTLRDDRQAAGTFSIANVLAAVNEDRPIERQFKAYGETHFVYLTRTDVASRRTLAKAAAAAASVADAPSAPEAAATPTSLAEAGTTTGAAPSNLGAGTGLDPASPSPDSGGSSSRGGFGANKARVVPLA